MKLKHLFSCVVTGLFLLPSVNTFAQSNAITITVLATFDVPGTGNSTTPYSINARGEISGYYTDSTGATRGFVRLANGNIMAPIIEPNDTGSFTVALGLNSSRTVVGEYYTFADNTYHGFFLSGGVYTQYDIGGPFSTAIQGINDAGNFSGTFGSFAQPNMGYVNIGGVVTTFGVAGAFETSASGISPTNQVVGSYDDTVVTHAFFRDTDGTITAPIDYPGSTYSVLLGINDKGIMSGRYIDASGGVHGMLFKRPNRFVSFDYPTAVETSLNGINHNGLIAGRYTDSGGIRHGFLARESTGLIELP